MSSPVSDVSVAWAEGDEDVDADDKILVITGPTHIRGIYLSSAMASGLNPSSDTLVTFFDTATDPDTELFEMALPRMFPLASILLPDDCYLAVEGNLIVSCNDSIGAQVFRLSVVFTGGSAA